MAKILQSCHFSALNLEKEYSREKITSAQPRMASTTDGVTDGGVEVPEEEDDGDERSGWDFFKSVIRTNLGPEVVEPELPPESATSKKSRPKVVIGKKKTNQRQGLSDVSQGSNAKEDIGENSGKSREEENMETTTLPPCSEMLPIDIERGFKCFNDTEVWTRCKIVC